MSPPASSFADFVIDQLSAIGHLRRTRFFGGIGLTVDGAQFGVVMGNTLYFVVDDTSRPAYEKLGSTCFSYATRKGQVKVRRYFEVPAQALEESAQLVALANQAIDIDIARLPRRQSRTKINPSKETTHAQL